MGRKKRGRRRRKSEAAQLAAAYNERGLEREVNGALEYQQCKKEHAEHVQQVKKREQELLSRTIFVTNVKDLCIHSNLELLKEFFESNYGPVEQCIRASYYGKREGGGGRYPKARVRFRHVGDARAVFGERPLASVDTPKRIYASIGHGGFLRASPSLPYPEMDKAAVDENKVVVIGNNALVGHWIPEDSAADAFTDYERDDHPFLFEDVMEHELELSIDINSRTVQIRLRYSRDFMMSFRFKDLHGTMEFYRETGGSSSYAVVFHLKYPPRLYALRYERDIDGAEEEIATRCLEMGGVKNETFGSCYAYMIRVSHMNLQELFSSKAKLQKLKNFGLLSRDLYSLSDAPILATRRVGDDKDVVEALLRQTSDR